MQVLVGLEKGRELNTKLGVEYFYVLNMFVYSQVVLLFQNDSFRQAPKTPALRIIYMYKAGLVLALG